jgi:hypothetical protein
VDDALAEVERRLADAQLRLDPERDQATRAAAMDVASSLISASLAMARVTSSIGLPLLRGGLHDVTRGGSGRRIFAVFCRKLIYEAREV